MDPLKPITSSQMMIEPELLDPYQQWQRRPTPQTRSALLRAVDPIINSGITAYGGPSAGSPNLRSQARRLALRAFDTYDPYKGNLKTHILSNLRGLQRRGAQEASIIRIPEQVALDLKHLQEAEDELRERLNRDPSDLELADHTGLSLKRLAYIRQSKPGIATGTFSDPETGEEFAPASRIPGVDPARAAWEELVYYDLNPTDQLIFDMLLGRHGRQKSSTNAVAAKLRISPSAVSQRAARIQAMLDEQHNQSVL